MREDGRRLMADGRWKKEEGRGQRAEGRGKKLSTRRIFYGYVCPQILVHVPVIFSTRRIFGRALQISGLSACCRGSD